MGGSINFGDYWCQSRSGKYAKIFHRGPCRLPLQPYLNIFPKLGMKHLIKERILRLRIKYYNHCARQSYTLIYHGDGKKIHLF